MTLQLLQMIKGNVLKPSLSYKLVLAFVWYRVSWIKEQLSGNPCLLLLSYLNGIAVGSHK